MFLLKVFSSRSLNWLDRKPELSKLLATFDVNIQMPTPRPSSVFLVRNALEELEVAAAVVQVPSPSSIDKTFGIRLTKKDCRIAGIEIDGSERGKTGILALDRRHANLKGNQEQFRSLVTQITRSIWEGEARVSTYSPPQLLDQIAVFANLPQNAIHSESRANCEKILSKETTIRHQVRIEKHVEICGQLQDSEPRSLIASRNVRLSRSWWEFWKL